MKKWFGFSLGTLLGISHLGMIGMISQGNKIPKINLPIGEYTSYQVEANTEGYRISYRAHDPKVMIKTQEVNRPAGFLGLGKKTAYIEEQYMAEGAIHTNTNSNPDGLSAREIACIKAQGSGESTGRLVGGGVGTAVVTQTGMASIPIVGWVLAGATAMMGMDQGAEIGGQMAQDFKGCEDIEVEENIK
tara:strand:+ start:1412 stop:1978 length:567 start_codon:yes stop_codon:yes gene_type:complete